jgi:hypothetical protein
MATTQTQCIHGFPSEHCVSCRTCEHGHPAGSCARCRTATPARKGVEPVGDQTSHDHAGYEIFYEPAVSGWRYRGADAAPSPLSYRSAFLARKAVDEQQRLHPGAPASAKGKGRKS